ncbi:MAG: septum formation initiator family protein [Propionibacteriaceae bacterium]|nr:septum formation initiator family protein [Propionibacteriaceae bacterium]
MAGTPRRKPTSNGPGRGSPRSRTAARPGERTSTGRVRPRPVDVDEVPAASEDRARGRSSERALGMTWRLLILGVVIAALAVTLAQSLRVYFGQSQEIATLRAQIETSKQEIADLEDQLSRWQDPAFVKAEARERLGWVMPGETGYRVIGADGQPLGGNSTVLSSEQPTGGQWWENMWGSVKVADVPGDDEDPINTETRPAPSPSPTGTP